MPSVDQVYDPDLLRETEFFKNYFVVQIGNGNFAVHFGGEQVGEGWLSGLWSMIKPLVISGGKALGKQALSTVGSIANDLVQGANIRDSARIRAGEAAHFLGQKLQDKVGRMAGGGRRKRRRLTAPNKRRSALNRMFSLVPPPGKRGRDLRFLNIARKNKAKKRAAQTRRVSKRIKTQSGRGLLF